MKRREFLELVNKAGNGPAMSIDDDGHWMDVMDPLCGLALHKERRMVTPEAAITFIRYQALMWSGNWDSDELENLAYCFRRVDLVAPVSRSSRSMGRMIDMN